MKITAYTPEELERLQSPLMRHYWDLYTGLPRWDGNENIEDKDVVVFCEQGYGDIIQFSRYFQLLVNTGCNLHIHCPTSLHRLFAENHKATYIKYHIDKLPKMDYHVLSMSLPFIFTDTELPYPYLHVKNKTDLDAYDNNLKIGIAWEGSPKHYCNEERSAYLKHFKVLTEIPNTKLFMLQPEIHFQESIKGAEDLEFYAIPIIDFYDTATLINAMDVVVSVDTAVLHLAGAMGKRTYGILSCSHDPRWKVHKWYRSVELLKHPNDDKEALLEKVACKIDSNRSYKPKPSQNYKSILITAGIGDFLTLDSFISDDYRKKMTDICLATRADQAIRDIITALPEYKHIKVTTVFDNFKSDFAIYSERDLELMPNFYKPANWYEVIDWSISVRFPMVHYGYYKFHQSNVFKHVLANIDKFNLPEKYAIISFVSENDRRLENREFSNSDWHNTLCILEQNDLIGVVINKGILTPPKHERIIDLTNRTTLLEAIEICKNATMYIGIDSCLSVIAAQALPAEKLIIKSVSAHCEKHKSIYYAPHQKFTFLQKSI